MGKSLSIIPIDGLIEKAKEHPKRYKPGVSLALTIASNALHTLQDWAGNDYDSHYIRVALKNTLSSQEIIIRILHDVLEDSDTKTKDLIQLGFNKKQIVAPIDVVTKKPNDKYFDGPERAAKGINREIGIQFTKIKKISRTKLADHDDNMKWLHYSGQ